MDIDEPQADTELVVDPPVPAVRIRRPSRKVREAQEDNLPEGPGPLVTPEPTPTEPTRLTVRIPQMFRTASNSFGLSRLYIGSPSRIPDLDEPLINFLSDGIMNPVKNTIASLASILFPYPNLSSFRFNQWFWRSQNKSIADRQALLDVLLADGFDTEDLRGVNFSRIDKILSKPEEVDAPWEGNGWMSSTVTIELPTGVKETKASKRAKASAAARAKRLDEVDPEAEKISTRKFSIPHFHHRSLIHVMRSVIEGDEGKGFHWHPFEQWWKPAPPAAPPERVFSEAFTGDALLKLDRDLQNSPREPGCSLPRVVAAWMFWSDATHLAQFGQSKLWPIYAYFANQTKYERSKPSARASHQIGYLNSVRV